jgi:hypothetical protein
VRPSAYLPVRESLCQIVGLAFDSRPKVLVHAAGQVVDAGVTSSGLTTYSEVASFGPTKR